MTDTDTDGHAPEFTEADARLVQRVALAVFAMIETQGDGRHIMNVAALLTACVAHSASDPIEEINASHNVMACAMYTAMLADVSTPAPATEETPAT
jgi:hypothetical protein